MNKKEIFISGICIIFSLVMGILSNDTVIGGLMMLMVSIGYFLLNIYGIVKWNKKAKESDY